MTIHGKDDRLTPYGATNLGMDLGLVDGFYVRNELFFVRSNGEIPDIDPAAWTLTVDGEVEHTVELSLAELQALPQVEQASFLECTGNGRSRFEPVAEGTTWKNDAAGNAVWGGIPLQRGAGARRGETQRRRSSFAGWRSGHDAARNSHQSGARANHAHRPAHEWRTPASSARLSGEIDRAWLGRGLPRPSGSPRLT